MLVLTRKLGEGIVIGNNVRVVIVDIRGNQVKLGIDAPSEVTVYREELYKKIVEENVKASEITKSKLSEVAEFWKKEQNKDNNK